MEGGVLESPDTTLDRSDDEIALQGFCSPKKLPYRFLGLALMCFLGFGPYFCFDNPSALQDNFRSDLAMSTSKFVLLYSIYSWPNVIFCFIGGFLLDSVFGIRLGTIIYMGLALVGQIIFATGAMINAFWLMMIGRFVFGIGTESLAVAQNSYAVLWFKGKELNMVFGLQLSFARVGSTVNFLVMEPIYTFVSQYYKGPECIGVVLFLATFTMVGSMICACVVGIMDKRAERLLRRGEGEEAQVVSLTDIKDFRLIFWLVALICIAYYVAIFPFIALGKVFFERKYAFDPANANKVNSLVYSISAIASPIFGYLVDRTGKNVTWVFMSILVTMVAHGLLAFTYVNPYVCMILMGLAYSMLASSLWPLIALVTPEYQLGTAYGIAQSVQNLGLAVVTILTGIIVDRGGYFMLEMFFLGWLWISLLTAVAIWMSDVATSGGYLNMTPGQRDKYQEIRQTPESLERAKLLSPESTSDLSTDDLLQPQSDTSIRNRYLSRIGAMILPLF
ncbi:major facilitator superfamily domain-containing protein 1-like isoform X2 [Hylaeus anthracinus]|uniref:major facilitator superfamily domain-containing protein 1-like isoform X2 n=1 Tax=Hylaeus volcanicus TaxID=313075 RepID=UPI0023B8249B|nr:major facilitator superfamily domain-containing protein 1-like isoform X2 [Hylaeus volcanicus]XP_054006283.1 major facilitator superfamily domain-containing protein 1-like isoform X2 [Hylaeus anthracinus]